ncbi:MAG: TonB-dependent receptor [Elusimicrobia bacterium]|nr:TonB-dependent receptor [Elusimicrobiota bacterium]
MTRETTPLVTNDNAWGKYFASLILVATLAAGRAPFTFGAPSPEVFLTLTRTELPADKLPTTTSVITAQEIRRSKAQSVADAIESATGITIRRNGTLGTTQLPSLRGFSAKQVLVVVDDKPLPADLTGTVDLGQIPIDQVERIEIVRGAGSVVYGANAEGGVIHIITRRPIKDRVSAEATSEFRSFGTQIYRAQLGLKRGPGESYLSVSRNLSDGFQENSAWRNTSLAGYWGYDFGPWGAVSFRGSGSKGHVGLASGTPVRDIGQFDGQVERQANRLTDNQADILRSYRLEHKLPLGTNASLTSRWGNGVTDREAFQFGSTTQIRHLGLPDYARLEILIQCRPSISGADLR